MKQNGISMRVETLTPQKAVQWLDLLSPRQRDFDKKYAYQLAEDIKAGQWRLNGEPIKWSVSGTMLDGQHRCHAVYIAKSPIDVFVVRGLPDEIYNSLDRGKRRGNAAILKMAGEQMYTELAAAISLLIALDPVIKHQRHATHLAHGSMVSAISAIDFLAKHRNVRNSVVIARSNYVRMMRPSTVAAFHYLYGQGDFMDRFVTGLKEGFMPTGKEAPLHLFREVMIANKMNHAHKLQRHVIYAIAIKAINAAKSGQAIKELDWKRDETFPEPLL